MKKMNYNKFGLILMIFLAPIFAESQDPNAICIESPLTDGFSNTEHSIAIVSPSLLPTPGTYNLTYLKYLVDDLSQLWSPVFSNPSAIVTVTPTQITP